MRAHGGFTLIEVLIGVLVLALGLLGLGAILPVVVREQRAASDMTQGLMCLADVKTQLATRDGFSPDSLPTMIAIPQLHEDAKHIAWDSWIGDKTWGGQLTTTPANQLYLWQPWTAPDTKFVSSGTDPACGRMSWIDATAQPTVNQHDLGLADRLWPSGSSQTTPTVPGTDPARPQFVWDVVGRRAQYGDLYVRGRNSFLAGSADYKACIGVPDVIQVAIFVRRVDINIRVPKVTATNLTQPTLLDVLLGTNGISQNNRRVAVAVDQNGLPTNNGVGDYGQPIMLSATFGDKTRDRITVTGTTVQKQLASQVGQKLIDNIGNIYTAIAIPPEVDPNSITLGVIFLDHPVPNWLQDPTTDPNSTSTLRQVIFTPQIPVAVDVLTIKRPVANDT